MTEDKWKKLERIRTNTLAMKVSLKNHAQFVVDDYMLDHMEWLEEELRVAWIRLEELTRKDPVIFGVR